MILAFNVCVDDGIMGGAYLDFATLSCVQTCPYGSTIEMTCCDYPC